MTEFVKAVNDFFLEKKGVRASDLAYMEMPDEKEKYNLLRTIGNVNLIAGRFKIQSEADAIVDDFLSKPLP